MGTKINILNEDTIGKIAAGEVVERPASVVKELIENSIDALADSIEVEIQASGQTLIRVADNGEGMAPEDAKLACYRHATSKIASAGDLGHITSMGFRGEALASIAAVSQMDIVTKTAVDEVGTYLYIESAQVQRIRPAARTTGTTVEVRNLFYNVPARRKFLKREATEMAEIVNVFGRFVLSHPGIEFKLVHGDRRVLDAPRNSDPADRVKLVLGEEASRGMMRVFASRGGMSLDGFATKPSLTRKDKKNQIFFLNGRFIRTRALSDSLQRAYRSMLERGRYPSSVIFLDIPPEDVDINVHPAKLQAKFRDEKSVRDMVEDAVMSALVKMREESSSDLCGPAEKTGPERAGGSKEHSSETLVLQASPDIQPEFGYKYEDGKPLAGMKGSCLFSFRDGQGENSRKQDFFVTGNCYIVQAGEDGVILTDQHAAHERVLYEFFTKAFGSSQVEVQSLLFPVRLDLSAAEAVLVENLKDDLAKLGFQIEPFGERSFTIRAVPAILKDRDVKTVVEDILIDLAGSGTGKAEMIDELIKIVSCRSAIKAGARLTDVEIEDLLEQLKKCDLPFTCPHGRPTTIKITVEDLKKMFRRT
jgi:DNA mismatch repair protein MutL